MGLGDELLAAGHAQRTFEAGDGRRVAITDGRGIARWHPVWDGNPILAKPADILRGESVLKIVNASGNRPYIAYPFTTVTGWRWTGWRARDHVGRIYFTPEEEALAGRIADQGPFVLIEPSVKKHATPNKRWGLENYQAVRDAFPDVRFVRPVFEDRRPFDGVEALDELSFRELCAVLARADAYIGAEGACHHAARILGVPAVVIFGGAISPEITGYPEHVNFADENPCGSFQPCRHCEAYFAGLTPTTVADALKPILRSRGLRVE